MRGLAASLVPLLISAFVASSAIAQATFMGLGDLPGGEIASTPAAVSADGSVVVGDSYSTSGQEAFLWTLAGGISDLGDLPGGGFAREAWDTSGDVQPSIPSPNGSIRLQVWKTMGTTCVTT
jgi:probable HAF family extracellular repeat protein